MGGVSHGEECKRYDRQNGADCDKKSKLLTYEAENRVGIGGKAVLEPTVASTLAEQTAGSTGRQSVGLLISGVIYIFPDMTPRGKSPCNMGFHSQHKKACHACTSNGECDGSYRA